MDGYSRHEGCGQSLEKEADGGCCAGEEAADAAAEGEDADEEGADGEDEADQHEGEHEAGEVVVFVCTALRNQWSELIFPTVNI